MDDVEQERLRSEIATLRLLLEVNEATALEQSRRAERALQTMQREITEREQQAKLIREIIAASTDSVVVLDSEWRVTFLNEQAKQELSSGEELVGQVLMEALPSVMDTNFMGYYRHAMKNRVTLLFEEFHAPRGKWYGVNVSPVGDGIGIFFHDATERRRRDAAIQKTEKLAAVGRLASSISHEINNPLESVVNLLYLIESSPGVDGETKMYAELATREMARVSHIVTQTLKFHRQSTHAAECKMSEVLESVVSLFQGRMATRKVRVKRRYEEHDELMCFAGDMRQVFANLIGNALDAIMGEGTIWLRTRRSRDWKTGRRGLRVCVADNGGGMSEETRKSLFEPFFTTKPATGTGLGLWVSEEIIRNHEGWVRVRSSERMGCSGTVFSVFFPVTD
ncbi:ATP-binding protein [Granulicella sp. dw_53]|uniref:two-component system sensor histidine kinase NtrB n=1 Tax=Granulicella sp. dw_53 TaxID=2719792 RepID=UPI001BD3B5B1|nr:ATP-binding protein [Granulicella sp. dw_53]